MVLANNFDFTMPQRVTANQAQYRRVDPPSFPLPPSPCLLLPLLLLSLSLCLLACLLACLPACLLACLAACLPAWGWGALLDAIKKYGKLHGFGQTPPFYHAPRGSQQIKAKKTQRFT